jgi:hypothetical protein
LPQVSRKHGARLRQAILVRMPKRNIRMVACVDQDAPVCSRASVDQSHHQNKFLLVDALTWIRKDWSSSSVKLRLVVIALILSYVRSTIPRSIEIGRGVKRKPRS